MDLKEIINERERKLNWYLYKNVDYDSLTEEQRKEIIRKDLENKERGQLKNINRIIIGTVLAPIWIPAWLGICTVVGISNLF